MSLPDRLRARLDRQPPTAAWRVGFSGGLDSTVLLHLLAGLREQGVLADLAAIHVHHGLQAAADDWVAHCQAFCADLDIPLQIFHVRPDSEASLERAAREARYAAFAQALPTAGCLLLGQHQDDQAETLLYRLLRGAGVRGLAAMPATRPLGAGRLWRPLLEESRATLLAYAQARGLGWIEDPSNDDPSLDRNYLRHRVLPLVRQRWPATERVLGRVAGQMAEAEQLLGELARQDLRGATDNAHAFAWLPLPSLALAPLSALSEARQRNALRLWLSDVTRLPDVAHWAGWQTLREAGEASDPHWRLLGGELRRGAGQIWWVPNAWQSALAGTVLPVGATATPLPDNGLLHLPDGGAPSGWRIAYRQGGEALHLPGRGRRDLKRLLNERAVPPFLRGRLPLLYADGRLLAVANLHGLDALPGGGRLVWQPPDGAREFELAGPLG